MDGRSTIGTSATWQGTRTKSALSPGADIHALIRVKQLALGSLPVTVVTLYVSSSFNLDSAAARTLITVVLCGALGVTAAVLIFRDSILTTWRAHFAELDARNTALVTVLVGAVLGVLVSISSVGAGAIGVMALVILYPRLSLVRIVGSDIAHAVPLTLIAGSDLLAIRRQLIPCGNRRVARSQYSVSGNDAELYLPRKGLLAEFVPALVKFSLVPICPFGSDMVRRMRRTGRKVDKKWLVGCQCFLVADPCGGLVNQVGG